jgi:hypothetical protein
MSKCAYQFERSDIRSWVCLFESSGIVISLPSVRLGILGVGAQIFRQYDYSLTTRAMADKKPIGIDRKMKTIMTSILLHNRVIRV